MGFGQNWATCPEGITGNKPMSLRIGWGGTLLMRNCAPPLDHHRALGIGLLQGPRRKHFLMSEVPMYGLQNTPVWGVHEGGEVQGTDIREKRHLKELLVHEDSNRSCPT